ncbi:hypothetical protein [Cellulomonas sp. Leaf334]|uniref:hypothetical protein n=1 Tax=Cellulomonas sp. Leaf334 TaxID=1736339 RepID=UPI0006F66820|nr:hypothetical protein [Cellulomonas sp. Leaf334]KQR11913.1 hypothetical protein ASF78_11980 [Cellulomonas sp. Leaf334]
MKRLGWAAANTVFRLVGRATRRPYSRFRAAHTDVGPSSDTSASLGEPDAELTARTRGVLVGAFATGVSVDACLAVLAADTLIRSYRRVLDRGFVSVSDLHARNISRWCSLHGDFDVEPDGAFVGSALFGYDPDVLGGGSSRTGGTGWGTCVPTAVAGLVGTDAPFEQGVEIMAGTRGSGVDGAVGGCVAMLVDRLVRGTDVEAAAAECAAAASGAGDPALARALLEAVDGSRRVPTTAAECVAEAVARVMHGPDGDAQASDVDAGCLATVESLTGQLRGALGRPPDVDVPPHVLAELHRRADDFLWTFGREGRMPYLSAEWDARYPPG